MALSPRWILLIHSIIALTVVADSDVVCEQFHYLEIRKSAVVSCEYDQSFYAVRWYRQGEENSFLRIDGSNKGGRGYTSGEFDIHSDGSMEIHEVMLKHENNYTISVLDSSGVVHSQQLTVYVTVFWNKPSIQNCRTSKSEFCEKLTLQQRKHTLVCIVPNSRPPVDITWETTSSNEESEILSVPDSDVVFNATSLTYTTFSFVQYHEEYFALEYVTCKIVGTAVGKTDNVSLYLEGKEKFLKTGTHVQYVNRGSPFQLRCPPSGFPLGVLKYYHPNGTSELVMAFHEGRNTEECALGTDCGVEHSGLFTIDEVSFNDEGSYECVFGNGTVTSNHVSNLTVVVSPVDTMTIIDMCEGYQECTHNTVLHGILTCHILGLRPSAHLLLEVADNSKDDVFLFNVKSQVVESSNSFTFDTILTAEYDIKECSKPVQVTCIADTKIHKDVTPSKVSLVTDNRDCGDNNPNTWIIPFVIVVLVVLCVLVIISVVFFRSRRDGGPKESPELSQSPKSESLPLQQTETNRNEENEFKKRTEKDGKEKESSQERKAEKERKAMQEKFNDSFGPIVTKLNTNKQITSNEITAILSEFNSQHEVKPLLYLNGFLKETNLKTKELLVLLKYIGESVPNSWISVEDFSELMKTVVEHKEPPVEDFLGLLTELYNMDLITLLTYADVTKSFLTKPNADFKPFLASMKKLSQNNQHSQLEVVNGILRYYIISAINMQTVLECVGYTRLPEKIPYPYFLQAIVCQVKGTQAMPKLPELLKVIFKKAMAEGKVPVKHESDEKRKAESKFKDKILETFNSNQEEGLTSNLIPNFLQVLLYSVEKKTIDVEACMEIVTQEVDQKSVEKSEYHKVLDVCSQDIWLSPEKFVEVLEESLKHKLVTEGIFVVHLRQLLVKKQLAFRHFVDLMERNLKEGLITGLCFEEQFNHYIKIDAWNKENWIRLVARLWIDKLIDDASKIRLTGVVIEKYKMKKAEMKQILDTSNVTLEDRKAFMSDVKF